MKQIRIDVMLTKDNYSNFQRLTDYLNIKRQPHKVLDAVITLTKPTINSINYGDKETEIFIR